MGISFDAPLALLLLIPVLALTIGLYLSARRRVGVGRRRVALRRADGPAVGAGPRPGRVPARPAGRSARDGVRRGPVRFGRATRDARTPWRSCARRSTRSRKATWPASSPSARRRSSSGCRPSSREIDRLASTPVRRRDRHRGGPAPGDRALPRRRPEAHRAAVGRQRHDRRRAGRGGPRGDARHPHRDPHRSGSAAGDEVLVERVTTPSTANLGESIEVAADIRSSVAQPATVRLFASGENVATRARDPRGRGDPRHLRRRRRKRPGCTRSGSSSRPPATPSARTTGRTRTRSSRASRERSCWPATRSSPTSSSRH